MHHPIRLRRPALVLAAAGALVSVVDIPAHAAPITGFGVPITTEQPSLGLTYLVRTQDPTNVADDGQVVLFAGNFTPGGYAVADGQLESIAANEVLFSRIGATYGGNGTTDFALPNLAGRTVVGTGQGAGLANRALGSVTGATTQILSANQLPAYGGASGILAGNVPVSIQQPSLALNETVVTQGFFPSSSGPQAQGPVIGQVLTYAGSSIANGTLAANGQQVPISQREALFSLLGNTYGGNFPITFALPNLSGRAPTEAGTAPGLTPQALGGTQGGENTTLTVANLPRQRLTLSNGTTAVVGGGQPFNLEQPTLGLHYIVAVQGLFPTQSASLADGEPFLGEVCLYAGTVAPAGWAFADGQPLSIAANAALFTVIGSTYGGNGISTFALPDLRDRVPVGTGDGVILGERFGADSETLDFAQLPMGYPQALSSTAKVPEPPATIIVVMGLVGLIYARRQSTSVGRLF